MGREYLTNVAGWYAANLVSPLVYFILRVQLIILRHTNIYLLRDTMMLVIFIGIKWSQTFIE